MRILAVSLALLVSAIHHGAAAAESQSKAPVSRKKPAAAKVPSPPPERWLTWGGPRRDFIAPGAGLASSWPPSGPQRLWSRALGDGYSAIAVEDGVLYTAFRRGSKDVTTALDAATGKTVWESEVEAPFQNAYSEGAGPGPYAMPQVVGDRIITATAIGKIQSLDKKTGKAVWSRDLYGELGGTRLQFGYSCHGLAYKDTLIFLAGGRGSAAVAIRLSDGGIVWKNQSFTNAHSSPLLIEVDGQPQVAALLAQEAVGFNPDDGQLLWRHRHATENGLAVSTPVWGAGNLLFISSAYSGGARVLHLARQGSGTTVKELWHNPRIQSHFGSVIRVGDYVYLSSGHSGPAFMTAVEVRTGRTAWQTRDFAKAQLLGSGDKLIVLDEDGNLGLAAATPQQFQVLARSPLLTSRSWTPPTLAGTRLYVRDRKGMMALELGADSRRK